MVILSSSYSPWRGYFYCLAPKDPLFKGRLTGYFGEYQVCLGYGFAPGPIKRKFLYRTWWGARQMINKLILSWLIFGLILLLYSHSHNHNDINHKSNTMYTQMQNTGGLCRFRYERVYELLASVHCDTRRETQFLKVFANHTMRTPPQRAAHLVRFKISFHLRWSEPDKLNRRRDDRKLNSLPQWANLNWLFSICSNSLDHLFQPWHLHTPAPFPVRGFIMTMVIVISFAHERKTAPNYYAPGLKRLE